MKYPSHGFLASKWLVHNHFVGLGNLLEVVVYYLLIGEIVGLGHRDEFPMVSALVCIAIEKTPKPSRVILRGGWMSEYKNLNKDLHVLPNFSLWVVKDYQFN